MQNLGTLSLLIIPCFLLDLANRFLNLLIRLDGGHDLEVSTFGRFGQVLTGIFLVFLGRYLGFRSLHFGLDSVEIARFLCQIRGKKSIVEPCGSVRVPRNCGVPKLLGSHDLRKSNGVPIKGGGGGDYVDDCDRDDECNECLCPEDEEFDVLALRRLVKMERRRANAAALELEKERIAAASAAEEAMAMIVRLQSEKSSIEIRANHDHRLAEQKQQYDRDVIDSLHWIVADHEVHRQALEERLQLYRQRLKDMRMKIKMRAVEEDMDCFDYEVYDVDSQQSEMADEIEEEEWEMMRRRSDDGDECLEKIKIHMGAEEDLNGCEDEISAQDSRQSEMGDEVEEEEGKKMMMSNGEDCSESCFELDCCDRDLERREMGDGVEDDEERNKMMMGRDGSDECAGDEQTKTETGAEEDLNGSGDESFAQDSQQSKTGAEFEEEERKKPIRIDFDFCSMEASMEYHDDDNDALCKLIRLLRLGS